MLLNVGNFPLVVGTIPLLDVSHQVIVVMKLIVQSSSKTVWYLLAMHDWATNAKCWEHHTCVQFFVKQTILYHCCSMVFGMLATSPLVIVMIPLLDVDQNWIVVVKLLVQISVQAVCYLLAIHKQATTHTKHWEYHNCAAFESITHPAPPPPISIFKPYSIL